RVFGLLGREPTVTSPDSPHTPASIDGDVTFEDVTFAYGDREPVLRDVSLDVPAGTTIGLAGATGAGKSTLLKLIPRFHDVDDGAVRVDGTDVREYDLQSLRDSIAIVEQNPYLFSGTVAENIAYGDRETLEAEWAEEPDKSARARVERAAEAAAADEFIDGLPNGYDTQVGERGVKLSGGQRQRLAIARALLNDSEIIVFDEATSDVDTETEELIQESLERLVEERTAFIIAHRLSTIQNADEIVVMDEGRIVEQGGHDELVASEGTYANLWQGQAEAAAADD
ncbi:ABC transporter ATP-binding protein, partial [Halorubrum sp. C3]